MNSVIDRTRQEKRLVDIVNSKRSWKARQKRRQQTPESLLALHYDVLSNQDRERIRSLLTIRQGGLCAICESEQSDRKFAIDHDHTTGHIRGLLCGRCNTMLGFAHDSITTLTAAIQYIERDRERNFI